MLKLSPAFAWIGGGQLGTCTAVAGVALTFRVAGSSAMTVDECAVQSGGTSHVASRAVHMLVAGGADAHLWSP
jgi:phosphoribosylaminoimidazole carboxylase (NCAIR synthetase)